MGGTWRQAWSIVGRELKIDRYYVMASLLFIAYMGFFTGMFIGEMPERGSLLLMLDLLFWAIASMAGYYFSRRITKYITEDSYTSMLGYYRTLPISASVLAAARMLQLLLSTLCNGTILFVVMYLVHDGVRTQMNLGAYLVFALTWTAFGLAFNSLYILLELLMRGRAYFWYSCVLLVVMELIVLIAHYSGWSFVGSSIRISAERGAASPALWILLILAASAIVVSYRIIVQRLPRRDLA
ncbi:hypothetical protein CDO73_21365 [Saccharibacillus sp. O23]|uniref:hypothetical protein n=1 Tax=Saccharibacillus sp. O23 TaxID=2009338 RepID=UPI000B4E1AEA|nr:hypothetical protein [Saccharibacillus sp. O23]OWR27740.1 hypothetical protein CDO73_21365 [Saccharibacillus sp. O23]